MHLMHLLNHLFAIVFCISVFVISTKVDMFYPAFVVYLFIYLLFVC